MEHTPGPWRVGDAGHTVFGPKTDQPSPKTIAHNLSRNNARLIASAPALLEALKMVLTARLIEEQGGPSDGHMTMDDALDWARAAIKAAKGDA